VDVRRAVDGELLDTRRQRNGTADKSTRAPSGVGDIARGLIEHTMIERLQANADILRFHTYYRCERAEPLPKPLSIPARAKTYTQKSKPPESTVPSGCVPYITS